MKFLSTLHPALIATGWYAIMSIVTFFAYGIDKLKAKKGAWRIPEKTLLGLGALGGAFGGVLGMKKFRHKTRHNYFWVINYAAIVIHIALLGYLLMR